MEYRVKEKHSFRHAKNANLSKDTKQTCFDVQMKPERSHSWTV